MITDYKYRLLRTQLMGCCFSDPQGDEVPSKEPSQMPFEQHPTLITGSPQKLNPPENGETLKQMGNDYFKRKQFAQAIDAYKRAIALPNPSAAYFSNLALAYKANGQYDESIQTVNEMIEKPAFRSYEHAEFFRKAQIVKARCIIIQVRDYCLSGEYSSRQSQQKLAGIRNAVGMLEEVTSVPNTNMEVQGYLQSGTKILRFLEEEVIPRSKHQSLLHYLRGRFQTLKLEGGIKEFYHSEQDVMGEIEMLVRGQMQLALQEPQQFIVDPITYDVFQSPVIVPSGQSYDEAILLEHFKNNGYNDPITHEIYKLGEKVIVRNLTLQAYIAEVRRPVNKTDLDYLKY